MLHLRLPTSYDRSLDRRVRRLRHHPRHLEPGRRGRDPYWHTWTFDHTGNRTTETRHGTTNTIHTYTYPNPGEPRPHTVTTVTASGADTWKRTYTYDDAGNTTTRPTTTGDTQTLTWDREGKLTTTTTTTDTTGDTSYIYDADGNRLLRTDPTGKTLYLPGGTEVRHTTDSTTNATRYYAFAGRTIAIRTATNLHWIISDHHGTAHLTIDATTLTTATRRTLPYGAQRATTTGTWPIGLDKGFLGGTQDPTGLTHLNAREYDPTLGRFISVDPIMDLTDPQQWNGYAYANNNPVTYSDPSGLAHIEGNSKGNGRTAYQTGSTIRITGKPPRLPKLPKSPPPPSPDVPSIPSKEKERLQGYINMVINQNPDTWNLVDSPAYNAIMVRVRHTIYGSPGWKEYWEALDGIAVSTVVGTVGAILCPASAGTSCILAVGAIAGAAGQCVDDCADAQAVGLAAVLAAVGGKGPKGKLSEPLPQGMNNKIAQAYDDVKAGRLTSHDTYVGREHPWWAGAKEYRVPGRPDSDRILVKTLPSGEQVHGWTSTHYRKIQRFSAPHFPDSGWK
nr:RHS repeat-associated core domain-containing protein [Salinispora arenicola]